MIGNPPKIQNAPGLTWRPRKRTWEARWQCRTDLRERGFKPATVRIWVGTEPDETVIAHIQEQCTVYQDEMLVWSRGGIPLVPLRDGTLGGMISCYLHDEDSPYRKLRYKSRKHYDSLMARLDREHGECHLDEINARLLKRWHHEWLGETNKLTMAHHMIAMIRIVMNFGSTFLEDPQAARLAGLLHGMKFEMAKPRDLRLTADMVDGLRTAAHAMGKPSIALAQAFQFECMFRQKDAIGEWVPISEPGISDIHAGNSKSLRGIRWEEVDERLVLRHMTSKRQKVLEIPLARAPMIVDELRKQFPDAVSAGGIIDRAKLPASGPIIVSEYSRLPWESKEFFRNWRIAADRAGIPKGIRNMDSRAGAITEATDAGIDLEHVRHAATHGDISMTQRYSRGAADKVAGVLEKRVAHRQNKDGK